MSALARGDTVIIDYRDPQERSNLAKSIGRRAAHRGFRVDIRKGPAYLSVRRIIAAGNAGGKPRKPRSTT